MDDPLISAVLDRLDRDDGMTDARESLVLGALEGRLGEVIDGAEFERPEPRAAGQEPVPVRAYLESVAVTGFRGIGPTCTLRLHPGPGLTLVAGRNGSGKSSIAEAAELTLTGNSVRWLGKSLEWKRGWLQTVIESAYSLSQRLLEDLVSLQRHLIAHQEADLLKLLPLAVEGQQRPDLEEPGGDVE